MNEVEKMYKNAEIKKKPYCELNCSMTKNDFGCTSYCLHYEDEGLYYPQFTAKKQIELIKWLAKQPLTIDNVDDEFEFSTGYELSDFGSFEESLAEIINNLWQDLTEEEEQQVKGILC